ncbi:hypothetical protein AGMMS49940_23490 [Spirochaetia bacterium]|nr:hypothetical protein AGMMS49940_23490 [Spirochaetia bacterium]
MARGIRFMKRFLVGFTLFCSIASMGFAITFQEDLEIYTYLYDNSGSPTEKFNIIQVLQIHKELTGTGEFYARAFKELVGQASDIRGYSATERVAADDLAQTLAALIGDEKYTTSAPDLRRAYDAFPNSPLVQTECLISLGKLRDTTYLPWVVQILRNLNAVSPRGSEEAEAKSYIARGAILALEKYRDISGYVPVFEMSVSGYPKRILDLAKATLPVILEDPSELLTTQVIRGSGYAASVKLVALQTIEESNVPQTGKAAAAAAALAEGWRSQPGTPRERTEIAQLRKLGIEMVGRYGASDPAVYPLLERSYKEGSDDEKISAVQTLGAVATEDSAKILSAFLLTLVTRIQDGARNQTDERMIREIIPAIGVAGKDPGRSLDAVINSPATPAVKDLAEQAKAKFSR